MKIYHHLTDFRLKYQNIVLALGMFDGLHIGHQHIIRLAIAKAQEIKGSAFVFSFVNHPRSVIDQGSPPLRIGSEEIRIRILERLGVDVFVEIPFTSKFSETSAVDFIDLLQECFAPKYIVVGENYTFGHDAKGTPELLRQKASIYGFHPLICSSVICDGTPISSTRIRSLISQGDLTLVNKYLGYPFTIIGTVVHGQARGRHLGFPTANISLQEGYEHLPHGVYAVIVSYKNHFYRAVANIGNNPTFNGCDERMEVHIFSFSRDLYGLEITVSFYKKIRDEKRFESVDALAMQIRKDKKAAMKLLKETFHLQENISMVI